MNKTSSQPFAAVVLSWFRIEIKNNNLYNKYLIRALTNICTLDVNMSSNPYTFY